MADPVIESTTETTDTSPSSAIVQITLDNNDDADDLLIMAVAAHPGVGPSTGPTGWTRADEDYEVSTNFAFLGWKKATGSEGSSIALTMNSTPDVVAAQVIRISNWDTNEDPDNNLWFRTVGVTSTPDPGSVTQGWGADDNLAITFLGTSDDAETVSSYPSGWTGNVDTVADGGANESAGMASAYLFSDSETTFNPGTWTLSGSEVCSDVTIVIKGGAGASTSDVNYSGTGRGIIRGAMRGVG